MGLEKLKTLKENQRPISNLHMFDKLIEQYLMGEMAEFPEENKDILDQLHGGIPGHSTLTANKMIDFILAVIISRDLS